jgi:phosphonate transport system substrate-binding protein
MHTDAGWRVSGAQITSPLAALICTLFYALIGALMNTLASTPALAMTYTLAIVPQSTAVDIGIRWAPVLEKIHKETGFILQIRASSSLADFDNEIAAGIPDFAFLNPYQMIRSAKLQRYVPLVRSSRPTVGILVTRKNGPIKTLADLKNQTVAFPAPNGFASSLFLRALLTEKEQLQFTAHYVGNHQNVYRHVLHNDAHAGGGTEFTLAKEPAGIRDKLTVLYRTPDITAQPLVANPRIPRQVSDQIIQALQRMARTPEGRSQLQQVALDDAVTADYARDYAPLEQLHLQPYAATNLK